jgi:hypothetical protein
MKPLKSQPTQLYSTTCLGFVKDLKNLSMSNLKAVPPFLTRDNSPGKIPILRSCNHLKCIKEASKLIDLFKQHKVALGNLWHHRLPHKNINLLKSVRKRL